MPPGLLFFCKIRSHCHHFQMCCACSKMIDSAFLVCLFFFTLFLKLTSSQKEYAVACCRHTHVVLHEVVASVALRQRMGSRPNALLWSFVFQLLFLWNRRKPFRGSEFLLDYLNFNYPELYEILSFKYKVGFPSLGWEIWHLGGRFEIRSFI